MVIVGQQEQDNQFVTLRSREDATHQEQMSLEALFERFESLAMPSSQPASTSVVSCLSVTDVEGC